MGIKKRAVITVIGKDTVGILAGLSGACADNNINVLEVSQSVMQDLFVMIMLVDVSDAKIEFTDFADQIERMGKDMNLSAKVMHEEIFNSMHRI